MGHRQTNKLLPATSVQGPPCATVLPEQACWCLSIFHRNRPPHSPCGVQEGEPPSNTADKSQGAWRSEHGPEAALETRASLRGILAGLRRHRRCEAWETSPTSAFLPLSIAILTSWVEKQIMKETEIHISPGIFHPKKVPSIPLQQPIEGVLLRKFESLTHSPTAQQFSSVLNPVQPGDFKATR